MLRIIKQGKLYKIQQLVSANMFHSEYWETLTYESVAMDGAGSNTEEHRFLTIKEAHLFINEHSTNHQPIEIIEIIMSDIK